MFDLPALGNGSRLVVGGQYQYDDARGNQGIAYCGIRIALGQGRKLSGLQRRMVNPVVRDVDIITNVGGLGVKDPAKFASTGMAVSNIVTIDGNTADPEGDFAAAGANSLVLLNGDAGTISADSSFLFNNGQVALGGGSGVPLVGCETGLRATYLAPGSRPTIDGGANAITIFALNDNNSIIGLNITGGNTGIDGSGTHQILDNHISFASGSGVNLILEPGSNLSGNTVFSSVSHGFNFINNGGTVSNNTAIGNDFGFNFINNSGTVSNNMANSNDWGFNFINVGGTVSNNTANGNDGFGFNFINDGGTVSNNTASGNGSDGFNFINAVGGTFSDNVSNNNAGRGYNGTNNGTATNNTGSGNIGGGNTFP